MPSNRIAYLPLTTYPDIVPDGALAAAVAVAAGLGCDLQVTAFTVAIPPVVSPMGNFLLNIPEMIRTTEEDSRTQAHRQQELVKGQAPPSVSVECSTRHAAAGAMGDIAASEARYFDLCLLPWAKDRFSIQDLAQAVVFGGGRPAILVPSAPGPVVNLDHVAVAWDGGRAAARALADVLPLLRPSARITVLTVQDEKKLHHNDIAERLAVSLRRRGFQAEARSVRLDGRSIADGLQDTALDAGAGLLAMGGFGHSRIRDFVLGGATTGVFADLRLPVLLSH